jgi:hypothetical protein
MIYSAYFTLKDLEYQHSIPGFIWNNRNFEMW